jgi:uncharacterized membrane protein YuzA (DUF378 family)
MDTSAAAHVEHFRQVLLWPLRLMPAQGSGAGRRQPWQVLTDLGDASPWRAVVDEYTGAADQFHERHYNEFVTFLPYVQRFLYGEGRSAQGSGNAGGGNSPIHVYRRKDISKLRMILRPGQQPVELDIVHVDLYFFDDLDLVQFNVEVRARDLPLPVARDILFRFGRAYPSGWDENGEGVHNSHTTEWLGVDGQVIACSDASRSDKFLFFVCEHRSPCISEHWASLLRPLALDHSNEPGELRYRLIEYHRMPVMAYLSVDQPRSLRPEDWIRIGLASTLHPDEQLPVNDPTIVNFDALYCQDRFWTDSDVGPNTRFICTGNALTVVGDSASAFFSDSERGVLAQFRHQYFLVFLLAHLHRASLLVFSDVLVGAVNALNIRNDELVRQFKRRIRSNFETFLRFTHRYWFHELSERPHLQAIFRMCSNHLRNDALYGEVRDEIREMSHYLDSDSQRRQSNTVLRLTVITIIGLIATVTTGYFGMNIIAFGEGSIWERVLHGVLATAAFTALILLAIARSKRLSDFLEVLTDEETPVGKKLRVFGRVIGNSKR